MDTEVSAFAVYKNNKSTNQEKKQRKRNKSKMISSHVKSADKSNVDEIPKDIALKFKKRREVMKYTKSLIKKKQHKKKNNKIVKNKNEKIGKDRKFSNIALHDDEIPTLVHVPMSTKSVRSSDSLLKEQYHLKAYDYSDTSSQGANIDFVPVETDSAEEGFKVFKWMIAPYDSKNFFIDVWEKKPLHIARNKPEYYKQIIDTHVIHNMLRNHNVQFTKDVDITSYINGKRETHNPEGRATPHLVWNYYLSGFSVRLLNPQTYIPSLHLLNATMQEYFNSFVGANVYLTPPDSQGFAPHYDDIEAFILQAEGKKHWRIYKPLNEKKVLPSVSSKNFDQNEIGEPILEVTLEAGDMLYFPRGYIHQAVTIDGEHSLHVTVSMYQKHSWADLFEQMLPAALQTAMSEHVELREGLPLNIYDHFGLVHSKTNTSTRRQISEVVLSLFDKIKKHLQIDNAVDEMHKNYQRTALPPVLNDLEKAVTAFGDSDMMLQNGKVINRVEIRLDTRIRLLRKNILRIVSEDKLKLYFYIDNPSEYHGNELIYMEINEHEASAVKTLIKSYPKYISVEDLNLSDDENKLNFVDALWSKGLIMTEYPLENIDDE